MPDTPRYGPRIKRLCLWLRLSGAELARAVGVEPKRLYRMYLAKTYCQEPIRRATIYLGLIRRMQRERERMLDTLWEYPACREALIKHGFAEEAKPDDYPIF